MLVMPCRSSVTMTEVLDTVLTRESLCPWGLRRPETCRESVLMRTRDEHRSMQHVHIRMNLKHQKPNVFPVSVCVRARTSARMCMYALGTRYMACKLLRSGEQTVQHYKRHCCCPGMHTKQRDSLCCNIARQVRVADAYLHTKQYTPSR